MSESAAVRIWRQKLDFLRTEEAKAVDPAQRFKLRFDIAEAESKIEELGGSGATAPTVARPVTTTDAAPAAKPRRTCKILFLAANPRRAGHLALDQESRQIEHKVRASDLRASIQVITKWAVQPDDLLQYLSEYKPDIVHFSGHGSEDSELLLLDPKGKAKPVSQAALVQLFTTLKDNVKLVMLNACYSERQAKAITQVIDFAVGMHTAVGDTAAIVFAAAFYRSLGFGRSVQTAFDEGKVALMLEGSDEATTPQLMSRAGINPDTVVLCGGDA